MLLSAVNVAASVEVENDNPPAELSRESKATSDGELARVGTFGVLTVFESKGKTRYISTITCETLGKPPVPATSSPVNEADVMLVADPTRKSSAASISKPAVPGREAMAIKLLGVRL